MTEVIVIGLNHWLRLDHDLPASKTGRPSPPPLRLRPKVCSNAHLAR